VLDFAITRLVVGTLLAASLFAQLHPARPVHRNPILTPPALGAPLPPIQPIPMLGMPSAQDPIARPFAPRPRFPFFGVPFAPLYYPPAVNNTIVVVQPPVIVTPPPSEQKRPEPIRPVLIEYTDQKPVPSPPSTPPVLFVLVELDQTEHEASAVIIQGADILFVDKDDRWRRLRLADLDRARTLRCNRDRNLTLRLPLP
jgi:hypothetical protein